ncbi:hypothetical protein, partial [Bathymodiolus thermophilus thioautotrophic gill symbiont]
TKTMKTGGAKTVYSWRNGDIVSETEGAKTTADKLKNPLSLTISDFISERISEFQSSTTLVTFAESEFYNILSECMEYVDDFNYKDMSAQEKISFFQGVKEKLSNFSNTGAPPPSMQAHIATLENYSGEIISRSEHRIRMNNKFPVTITKGNKVSDIIHYVWTGGAMPKSYLDNIKAIKRQNDKLTVRLHYDPDSLLMNELKKRMQTHVDNNLTVGGNRRYEAIKLTKRFSDYCGDRDLSSDVIKGFMVDVLGVPIAEVNEIEEKSNKYWGDFPGDNPNLELAPISFDDTELSGMKEAYQFELKNGSMAGASDIVRFSVLHTEGGMYADVGLIFDRSGRNNFLYNYIQSFPENGFAYKQAVASLQSTYPLVANNNFLVAAPHSEFTGTLVQDISEAYNRITSNEVEEARRSYGSNQVLDQYDTSIVPLNKFYLDHVNHLSIKPLNNHILDAHGSWQSKWNAKGVEFIVFIVDTESLSDTQRRSLIDNIERNVDGYNNDAYKVVVLDSHAVVNPVRREVIEHRNPFFTVQKVPVKSDGISINYPKLFERSRRIIVHDNDNNFEPMLEDFSSTVERSEPSEFNKTIEGVTSARCFQVFLFDDRANFKQTIRELAPDISKENYVALVYDKSNQKYDVLDGHDFEFNNTKRLKVNFIGELSNLESSSEIQKRIFSAESALPQIDIKGHTKETRVVLSKDMSPNQSLFKIEKTFSDDSHFYTNKGTVSIHAQNNENKSNATILINNKAGNVVVQDNAVLTWKGLTTPEREFLQRTESESSKSNNDSLNKYHNVIVQSSQSWYQDSYDLACDTNFKGNTSIVQITENGFRTIYGTPPSSITGDVRVIFAFNKNYKIVNNVNHIREILSPDAKISDIRLINRTAPSVLKNPDTEANYMEHVSRITHRYKDAQVSMQQGMQSNKYLFHNYSFHSLITPSASNDFQEKGIIFKISNGSSVNEYADRVMSLYPNNSYIATLDPITNEIRVYDSYGNIVTDANINGKYEIHVLGRVSDLERIGSESLSDYIVKLQKSIKITPEKEVSVGLTVCSTTDSATSDLLFDSNNYALNVYHKLAQYNQNSGGSIQSRNILFGTDGDGIRTLGVINAAHLAETTPHQNTPLHNWVDLSQEQINKLALESQKTKPSLANHDHQVLIQTEADDNVKDNTSRLA